MGYCRARGGRRATSQVSRLKAGKEDEEVDDGIMREFLGIHLPEWLVGFQISLAMADDRIHGFIHEEFHAKVWNYTKSEGGPPAELDPVQRLDSPENVGANKGFDFTASICNGLVLSPALFKHHAYLRYADPLFDEEKEKEMRTKPRVFLESDTSANVASPTTASSAPAALPELTEEQLLKKITELRLITKERLSRLDELLAEEDNDQ